MKVTANKRLLVAIVAIVVLLGVHQVSPAAAPVAMLPVDVQDVVVADSFWAPRMQIIRGSMIPHSWNHVKGAIQELRCVADPKAAKPEAEHRGRVNNAKPLVTLAKDPKFTMKFDRDLLGGVMVIRGKTAEDKPFTAIPYYAFANRENANQEVWLPQQGKTESERGWQGRLYRSWQP